MEPRVFLRQKWTRYLGELRPVHDIYVGNEIFPSPTPSVTPSLTPTNTTTPTLTQTSTSTNTPSVTQTPTLTPTNTVTPSPTCINYDVYIGTGDDERIAYSNDGFNWSASTLSTGLTSTTYYGINYGNGIWVAAGNKEIAYSPNAGRNWYPTIQSGFTSTNGATTIGWNGSYFLSSLRALPATSIQSTDGITWTTRTLVGKIPSVVSGIEWIGDRWIRCGSGTNRITYSFDGINWSASTMPSNLMATRVVEVAFNGQVLVAVGYSSTGNTIGYSLDKGLTFSTASRSGNTLSIHVESVAWDGEKFIAVGNGYPSCGYSYDGINWYPVIQSEWDDGESIIWDGTKFISMDSTVLGDKISVSYDGFSWSGTSDGGLFSQGGRGIYSIPQPYIYPELCNCNVCPSPTPTWTSTSTPSLTPSVSQTSTPGVSPTSTPTVTQTQTQTPSNTTTQTSSPTNTPSVTQTSSPTSTQLKVTPTSTPTLTQTSTQTNTPSVSPTGSLTPTPEPTTTQTNTPSVTNTQTNTPSVTQTQTMTPTRADNCCYVVISNGSLDITITDVTVSGVSVSYDSGTDFPISPGEPLGQFYTFQTGATVDVVVYFTSSISGQNISIQDCAENPYCQETTGGGGSFTFSSLNLSCGCSWTISASDGACV